VSPDKNYAALGMITTLRTITTKKGDPMSFATLEDYSGSIELVFFPEAWKAAAPVVKEDAVVALIGKVDLSRGEPKLLVDRIVSPEELPESEPTELHIRLGDNLDDEGLYTLRSMLMESSGRCAVYLHLNGSDGPEAVIRASAQLTVAPKSGLIDTIKGHPRVAEVWNE